MFDDLMLTAHQARRRRWLINKHPTLFGYMPRRAQRQEEARRQKEHAAAMEWGARFERMMRTGSFDEPEPRKPLVQ